MLKPTVAVIIAAYNASETISRSIKSALSEPSVSEVIVVDDCSTDDTVATAKFASAGDSRFKLLTQSTNLGPSAARNRAIDESKAELIAILDADDVFLKGRLDPMLKELDWDLCADNIYFVTDEKDIPTLALDPSPSRLPIVAIDIVSFIEGNISSPGNFRGELGFLKPIIRKDTLIRYGIRYNERCRLGEDFLLYFELLARGAKFRLISDCGYAGLIRANSLSGKHRLADIEALYEESRELQSRLLLSKETQISLLRHTSQLKQKIDERRAIAIRHEKGILLGVVFALSHPRAALSLLRSRVRGSLNGHASTRRLLTDQDYHRLSIWPVQRSLD